MPRAALILWPVTLAMVLVLANVAIASEPTIGLGARHHDPIVPRPLASYPRLVARSVTPARLAQAVPTTLTPPPSQVFNDAPSVSDCLHRSGAGGTCILGDPSASRSFALIGDSHAGTWISALNYFAMQHHYRLIVLTHEGCTVGIASTGNDPVGHCNSGWWTGWLQKVSQDHPEFVVIAQYFDPRVPPRQMYLGMRQELNALDQRVPRTVVMEDPPHHLLINPPDCLLRSGATLGDCTFRFPAAMSVQYATLRGIVESHPKDRFLQTRPWFCSKGKCPVVIGNMIAFRDTNHMSDTYSRHLAPAVSHYLWELTRP